MAAFLGVLNEEPVVLGIEDIQHIILVERKFSRGGGIVVVQRTHHGGVFGLEDAELG